MNYLNKNRKSLFLISCAGLAVLAIFLLPDQAQAFNLFPGEEASIQYYRKWIQNFYRFAIAAGILLDGESGCCRLMVGAVPSKG